MTLKVIAVLCFLGVNYYAYHHFANDMVVPDRGNFDSFPLKLGDWHCASNRDMGESIEKNLGVTDYLLCDFLDADKKSVVNVYIGYHAIQARTDGGGVEIKAIHPPKHCLPGSGWNIIDAKIVTVDLPGLPRSARVNRLVIAKGNSRQLVYYWYQSRGRVIAEDWKKILYLMVDRATKKRTDGALVRFTVPFAGANVDAESAFGELASEVLPKLPNYVPN